jgi:hypothetical protein
MVISKRAMFATFMFPELSQLEGTAMYMDQLIVLAQDVL